MEKALSDPSSRVKLSAVDSLGKIGDVRNAAALAHLLQDENETVVAAAVLVLAEIGDDAAVAPLLGLLKTGGEDLRMSVCFSIGKLRLQHPQVVADSLLSLLDDANAGVRFGAMASLGTLREKRAVPRLLEIAEEKPTADSLELWTFSQPMVLSALGEIGDPAAIPRLVKLLEAPAGGEAVVEALTKIGDSTAAKPLLEQYVRTAADVKLRPLQAKEMEAIGKLGTTETRAELEAFLPRCPPMLKQGVRAAILAIDQRLPR